jgi:hypothetical protein
MTLLERELAGESPRPGGRRRLLADETAGRDSRVANLTESAQEDCHSKFYELSDNLEGAADMAKLVIPDERAVLARLLAGLRVLINARLAIPQHNSAVRRAGRGLRRELRMFIKAKMLAVAASAPRPGAMQLRRAVGIGQWR